MNFRFECILVSPNEESVDSFFGMFLTWFSFVIDNYIRGNRPLFEVMIFLLDDRNGSTITYDITVQHGTKIVLREFYCLAHRFGGD